MKEFAIVLRISGELANFEGEGVQKVRVSRKGEYVTADFVIPESRWKGVPFETFKRYLAAGATATLKAMATRLVKVKIPINSVELLEDVSKATTSFLGGEKQRCQVPFLPSGCPFIQNGT